MPRSLRPKRLRPDLMNISEAIKIAFLSLWANKLRSALTLLGVVIGVAAVIAVVTFVNGINGYVATRSSIWAPTFSSSSKFHPPSPTSINSSRARSAKTSPWTTTEPSAKAASFAHMWEPTHATIADM